ncbi:MAG: alanine dehydrogenase [Cyclobacteriaceae bacterium]|nr:alanine dehydrogenase [Cyclobacteriaceae bacterium]
MAEKIRSGIKELARESALYPLESPLKIREGKKSLQIGVPIETSLQENRVTLKPEAVNLLVNNGHEVWVETGAGEAANFKDNAYSEAGAKIVYDRKEIYQSEIILKVEPPTKYEMDMIRQGVTLISAIQPGTQSVEFLKAITQKKITALGYEFIEDKVGGLPLVRAMSEIAGSTVMMIAGEYLSKTRDGQGIILGGVTGVPPTQVVIVGAGTVAEYATRAALGLGVDVQVFDNQIYKLRRLKHAVGQQVYTSTIDPTTLEKAIRTADVVIGAVRGEKSTNKVVVSEQMVAQMKPGSVIIDVSIDQGGCIETSSPTTLKSPVFKKHDVIHYCVPNIASRVARTATIAISNIFSPILLQIADAGGVEEMMFSHSWFTKGVYAYKGSLTNLHLARKYNMGYKDLSLLMAARF